MPLEAFLGNDFPRCRVDGIALDLSDPDAPEELHGHVHSLGCVVEALVVNAGVVFPWTTMSASGLLAVVSVTSAPTSTSISLPAELPSDV